MLLRVVNKLRKSNILQDVIIACPEQDKEIIELAEKNDIKCFGGSELDVLNRYFEAATKFNINPIVRITSDCPLIDPKVVDKVIESFYQRPYDYCTNRPTYPDGMDVEVFTYPALVRALYFAKPFEYEHVTTHFQNHPDEFKIGEVRYKTDLSMLKWSVDYAQDLEFAQEVYLRLGEDFTMEDILSTYYSGLQL